MVPHNSGYPRALPRSRIRVSEPSFIFYALVMTPTVESTYNSSDVAWVATSRREWERGESGLTLVGDKKARHPYTVVAKRREGGGTYLLLALVI